MLQRRGRNAAQSVPAVSREHQELLEEAVSGFKAQLTPAQRSEFDESEEARGGRTVGAGDVTELVTKITREYAKKAHKPDRGRRLAKFLRVLRQFCNASDIVLGGPQNHVAPGVWVAARLCLEVALHSFEYFDKVWELLQELSTYSNVYQDSAEPFPDGAQLQEALCKYLSATVDIFAKIMSKLNESELCNVLSSFEDDFSTGKAVVERQARQIKECVAVESTAEQLRYHAWSRKETKKRAERKNTKQLLAQCTAFNYDFHFNQILKVGASSWLQSTPQYLAWAASTEPSILWLEGFLGCGKSVMLANAVEGLRAKKDPPPVYHHFCSLDEPTSLFARTIVGSIARQFLLAAAKDGIESIHAPAKRSLEISDMLAIIERISASQPAGRCHYMVLDGLHEMENKEQKLLLAAMRRLMRPKPKFSILISSRPLLLDWLKTELTPGYIVSPPEARPEIEEYIHEELSSRIFSGELVVENTSLAAQIQQTLLEKGKGMFLWIALQIEHICEQTTDVQIIQALSNLPSGLDDTYSRILQSVTATETADSLKLSRKLFTIVLAAQRQLTLDEVREAVATEPGKVMVDPLSMQSMRKLLKICRSLLVVDEEELTVHFAHHSVRSFITNPTQLVLDYYRINEKEAGTLLANICVTYLNQGNSDRRMVETPKACQRPPHVAVTSTVMQHIRANLSSYTETAMKDVVLRKPGFKVDESATWKLTQAPENTKDELQPLSRFFSYAREFWLLHMKSMRLESFVRPELFMQVVDGWVSGLELPWDVGSQRESTSSMVRWACFNHHIPLMGLAVNKIHAIPDKDVKRLIDEFGLPAIRDAVDIGTDLRPSSPGLALEHTTGLDVVQLRLREEFELKDGIYSLILHSLIKAGRSPMVRYVISKGANPNGRDKEGVTPLMNAIEYCDLEVVSIVAALLEKSAKVNEEALNGWTVLQKACYKNPQAVKLLVANGADVNQRKEGLATPLQLVCHSGYFREAQYLHSRGADLNAAPGPYGNALEATICSSSSKSVKMVDWLLSQSIDVNLACRHYSSILHASVTESPVHAAIGLGATEITRKLLDGGADVYATDSQGQTPLGLATANEHGELSILLLRHSKLADYLEASARPGAH